MTSRAAPVEGAVTLINSNLLQYQALAAPLSSADSAGFGDALIDRLDKATVLGSPERKVSFQKLFGDLLRNVDTPQLVLTQADYNALVAADNVLIKPPSVRECLFKKASDRSRVPTPAYQRYQGERSALAMALDRARATCEGSPDWAQCTGSEAGIGLAKQAMMADPNVPAIEVALRVHARVGMNDPKLRLAEALRRYDTFSKTRVPWDGREGSATAWLGSGEFPDLIPGTVGVSDQLPKGAKIRTIDPDWLDYELLVSSQIYLARERATPLIGSGLLVPRYIVFLPPTAPTAPIQVLGVISSSIRTGDWLPSTSADLGLPPPRTSMQAQSLLREGARAYSYRGLAPAVAKGADDLTAANWEFASLSERYQAAVLLARLRLWQAMQDNIIETVGNWAQEPTTPERRERFAAFQAFRQQALRAYGISRLFSPELGISAPCEGSYLLQLDAMSSIMRTNPKLPERYGLVIKSLLALKTDKTVDGQDCTLFDDGGIDRFVGRSYYRIAQWFYKSPNASLRPQQVAIAKLSMQFLGKAYDIEPLLPANVDYYTYALLGILSGYSTPESEERACKINIAFRDTLIPKRLETLTKLIDKLRKQDLNDLMPECGKTP